ncbi:hypothetical protein [Persicobacter sp. CCB-QB2]|uniref:hypothetical protein n=1 Tax=Persicobacter sp. CCB-QB2 TaxID=1561025 RepID=UPI0006A96AEF|nr:hypothetical protein [Persicobacter sp. CCB-QB2]
MNQKTNISMAHLMVLLLSTLLVVAGPVVQSYMSSDLAEVQEVVVGDSEESEGQPVPAADLVLKPFQAISSFSLHFFAIDAIIAPQTDMQLVRSAIFHRLSIYNASFLLRLLECQLAPNAP